MSRIPPAVAAAVIERAHGFCELDPAHLPEDSSDWCAADRLVFHHRQARAMGGSKRNQDTVDNLLYLHDGCHQYIHAHPEWSREHGYIVSQYEATP